MTDPNQFPEAAIAIEDQNPLAAVGQALQGFAGRIGTGLRTGYEAVRDIPRNIKTYEMLGVSAITSFALSHAEAAVADPDSVVTENIPARSAEVFSPNSTLVPWAVEQHPYEGPAAAIASSTKQECLPELKQPPYNISSVMIKTSNSETLIKGSYGAVEGCDSWKRLGMFREQLKQHGHWLGIEGDFWYPTDSDIADKNAAHKFGALVIATRGVQEKRVHGHWEPARVQFRNEVRNAKTGKLVATGKIKNHSVKIEG